MKNRRGFTLVEIMIVVAIIALLAAIAIPNLLRARLTANEAAAQAALKTLATAQITYRTAHTSYASLSALDDDTPPYIDTVLAAGTKNGYLFSSSDFSANGFVAGAVPQTTTTGSRSFCITEDGVVKIDTSTTVGTPSATTHDACQTTMIATSP